MSESRPIDRQQLEQLYERFGVSILRRALRILADEQLARDVCHDVLVLALRCDPWPPPSPLAWLTFTTTNLCLNLLRADRRRRAAFARMPRPDAIVLPTEATLLLQRVPPALHEIAIYRAIDQMSEDEIALVLGVPETVVSERIRELQAILDPAETA